MIAYLYSMPGWVLETPRFFSRIECVVRRALQFKGSGWWAQWFWFNVWRWLGMCGVGSAERVRLTTRWVDL